MAKPNNIISDSEPLNYICKECGIEFEEGENYASHIKSHEAEEILEYNCNYCNFNTKDLLEIQIHSLRHKLKCDKCELVCEAEKDLKIHEKQMHENQCSECECNGGTSEDMTKHKEEKHNKKKDINEGESNKESVIDFQCDKCDFQSKSMIETEKHSKMSHFNCDKC